MLSQSSPAPAGRGTSLKVSIVFIVIAALAACETTDQPLPTDLFQTPAELYEGRAIISVGSITLPASAEDHRLSLNRPFSERLGVCQVPTTNAVVEAVNDVIRSGRQLQPDELYLTEEYSSIYGWSFPKGTFRPDIIEMLLIDSRGRSVTISDAARNFDGNYYDYGMAGMEAIYQIIDIDGVWKACHRLYQRESVLQHD